MFFAKRTAWQIGLMMTFLALAGCASNPPLNSTGRYSGLYSGKSELAFSTLMPVNSAAEGVARGDKAYSEGKLDLAVFEYIRALELDPDDADTFYKIGAVNLEKHAYRKAESAFRLSLTRNPQHGGALEGLGLILLQRREYSQARQLLEQASQQEVKRWQSFSALGILADLRGDFAGARVHYESALGLSPRNPQIHNNLGYSYYLAGEWAKAENEYRAALNADPNHQRAWRNLGQLYTRRGRYFEAFDALSHAMDKAAAYNTIGFICMSEGQYDRAEDFFRKAVRSSPSYHIAANENLEQLRRLRVRK